MYKNTSRVFMEVKKKNRILSRQLLVQLFSKRESIKRASAVWYLKISDLQVPVTTGMLRWNPPGLQVLHGQNYIPKLFTSYCKLLCYCFKYTIKRNHF